MMQHHLEPGFPDPSSAQGANDRFSTSVHEVVSRAEKRQNYLASRCVLISIDSFDLSTLDAVHPTHQDNGGYDQGRIAPRIPVRDTHLILVPPLQRINPEDGGPARTLKGDFDPTRRSLQWSVPNLRAPRSDCPLPPTTPNDTVSDCLDILFRT